ncbi:MAG: hypothetical protein AAF414_18555 [Pseudomonadota bacterium]
MSSKVTEQETLSVAWAHGELSLLLDGAMCAPVSFKLGDGNTVQPFALVPWQDEKSEEFDRLVPLLKWLRGEWVCVPFGMPATRDDLPADWAPDDLAASGIGSWFHGPGANLGWREVGRNAGGVTLEIVYPDDHPIERLVRTITGSPHGPRLDFELSVHPRADCKLPVGVHPVFRLPEEPGAAILSVAGDITVNTYPVDAEVGVSKLPHNATFRFLETARWADGVSVDLSRHPLSAQTEEIVLVTGVSGHAALENHHEGYRVDLRWDPSAFESCNLWISNRGRGSYPWNNRFCGLGIEPVSAPFDLGVEVANSGSTPLHGAGHRCGVDFTAGTVWRTRYSIDVAPL